MDVSPVTSDNETIDNFKSSEKVTTLLAVFYGYKIDKSKVEIPRPNRLSDHPTGHEQHKEGSKQQEQADNQPKLQI